jgi:pyrrolysyl-tRNA synthetase-like protein
VRIFEIGACFRKESEGAHHLNEFTMLNLVEMGLPEPGACPERLRELAELVLSRAGIFHYQTETTRSDVYGSTVDFTAGFELGSGAIGPHPLDEAWDIHEAWTGIGFGLERLIMARKKSANIKREGKSLTYLDGIRLNL